MSRLFAVLLLAACNTPEGASEAEPAAAERAAPEAPALHGTAENVATEAADAASHWGAPFTLTASEPLQTLIDDPDPQVGREVRVRGEVTNVCQKAGCWMVLRAEGGESVRITMKDHDFSVAKDLAGRSCDVQGTVVKKAVDPKTVAHYESEGGTDEVPERGKTEVVEIVATSVAVASK